jgi:hypothetical protein
LQRLLDGVPERWRDAEMAWWPNARLRCGPRLYTVGPQLRGVPGNSS